MPKNGKLTPRQLENLAEFKKQRRRIQQFKSRARKRGYIVDDIVVPDIPKTATKRDIQKLAKLTPEKLYKKITKVVDLETGELLHKSGAERRKEERKASAKKAAETRKRVQEENYKYFDDLAKDLENKASQEVKDLQKKHEQAVKQRHEQARQNRQSYTPDFAEDVEEYVEESGGFGDVADRVTNAIAGLPSQKWLGYNKPMSLEPYKNALMAEWIKIQNDYAQNNRLNELNSTAEQYYQDFVDGITTVEADSAQEAIIGGIDKIQDFFSRFTSVSESFTKTLSEYSDLISSDDYGFNYED